MKEIIEHQEIRTLVENYQQVEEDFNAAMELLQKAKERMSAVLVEANPSLWYGDLTDFILDDKSRAASIYRKKQTWAYIMRKAGIIDFMSPKKRKEVDKQLHYTSIGRQEDTLPDITVENIYATLEHYTKSATALVEEAAKEVFEWLRPYQYQSHKTNKKYQIGNKAIKLGVFSSGWDNKLRLRYDGEAEINALENLFSLLDGKGIKHYPDDLATKIKEVEATQDHLESEYFKLKWYRNNNLHIEFKRLDLLKQLNRIGGNQNEVGE